MVPSLERANLTDKFPNILFKTFDHVVQDIRSGSSYETALEKPFNILNHSVQIWTNIPNGVVYDLVDAPHEFLVPCMVRGRLVRMVQLFASKFQLAHVRLFHFLARIF